MLCTSSAHQPYHSDQGSLCFRQMLSGNLQRQKVIVPSLLLGHHAPTVGPDLLLSYLSVLIREETAHGDLPSSQHTLTPLNTRGRSFIICDVIMTGISSNTFTPLVVGISSISRILSNTIMCTRIYCKSGNL